MSVAKLEKVKKSRKPGVCEKCKTELPVGSPYQFYYVGFRSSFKHVRCMNCTPRPSERESSLLATVLAAQEDAEDQLDGFDGEASDLEDIIGSVVEALREVASQYEEASTDASGNTFNYDAQERSETLGSAADELEGFTVPDATIACEACEGVGTVDDVEDGMAAQVSCPECDGTVEIWDRDAAVEEVREAISNVELP